MQLPFTKLVCWISLLVSFATAPAQPKPHEPKPHEQAPAQAAAAPNGVDPQTTYSLTSDREPLVSLAGEWRFQPGDDPRWASPAFDDSHWALVRSDRDWEEGGYRNLAGTAWLRFHVTLPPGEEPYTLRLPVIYTCYQVFVDGRLLLTEGYMPPHARTFNTRPVLLDLPSAPRTAPQTLTFALRVWHDPLWMRYRHGGLQNAAEIGRSDLVHAQFDKGQQAQLWQYSDAFDLGALELLAFAVALVLFLARRSEREFLWFALLVLGQGGLHLVGAWKQLHANDVVFAEGVQTLLQTTFLASALLFFRSLFRGAWTNAFTFALACCGLNVITFPLSWMGTLGITQSEIVTLLLFLPVYGWIVLFINRQARKRQPDARVLRVPITLLFASLTYSQILWVLSTAGLPSLQALQIRLRRPFYLTLDDLAEVTFLTAMLVILLRRFALRSREQDRVESELEAARSVQQVLVPESLPRIPGLAIATAYHPAQEVGGDFFQILPLPSGATLIIIGDVAGKGLPAALQVSLCVGTLRALAEGNATPAAILAGLNRSLQGRGPGFTTCLALAISADRTALTFANAGHIAPYVNGFELRTEGNLPLGLVPEATFDEARYALSPGDHLTVLTDGVPEATQHRQLFGFERTGLLSRQTATEIADAARTFGQTDDITVLTVDIVALPATHTQQLQPALQPA